MSRPSRFCYPFYSLALAIPKPVRLEQILLQILFLYFTGFVMDSKKYDFFILQSSTAAGHALNEFLRAHPAINMPDRELVDRAFQCQQDDILLAPQYFPAWPNDYRHGFLLHARIQLDDNIPERVDQYCKNQLFLQLVRDPVDVITASHKRYIQMNVFRQVAEQLNLSGYRENVPMRTPEEVYEWLKPRLFYYQQGQRFAGKFKDYHLIDGCELWPDKVDTTMQYLYELIGVNNDFRSPLFKKDFHGLLQRAMEFSGTTLDIYGYSLPVRLDIEDPAEQGTLSLSDNIEIAHTRQTLPILGSQDKEVSLVLVTSQAHWLSLPLKLRKYLHAEHILQQALEEEIVPTWLTVYDYIKQFIEQRWGRELPNTLVQRMKSELNEDYEQLFRLRPELETLWTSWRQVTAA